MQLVWDKSGEKLFETGVEKVVLFPVSTTTGTYPAGYAWNGVTNITESPSGAEASPYYANNKKYLNLIGAEEFAASLEAYTYPDEFGKCDGSAELTAGVSIGQQARTGFGLAYSTILGNDIEGVSFGRKLHFIYGAMAAPSEKAYASVNESTEPGAMSWEISTTPVEVTGHKPTSSLTIDSTKVDAVKLAALEAIIYGTALLPSRLPLPDEIASLMEVVAG